MVIYVNFLTIQNSRYQIINLFVIFYDFVF